MKITTTKVVELDAKETATILCERMESQVNPNGELGRLTAKLAEDVEGLATKVTMTFVLEPPVKETAS